MPAQNEKQMSERQDRYASHTLIEIRKYKNLPFNVQSAVLLDISLGGFKAEFTGEANVKPGTLFWIAIPLRPLGIFAPNRLFIRGECRWFDGKKFRLGGVFLQLGKSERLILEQVIDTVQAYATKNPS